MSDGTGLAEALLGLDGPQVLEVTEYDVEVVIDIETPEGVVGRGQCGAARGLKRRTGCRSRSGTWPASGDPRLVWHKRRVALR